MSSWQRIKSIIGSIVLLLSIPVLIILKDYGCYIIAVVLSLWLLLYGVRMTWYYFSMARHMVGGKTILVLGLIVLELGLFTITVVTQAKEFVLVYLIGVYAFGGAIDILRALEAKRGGAPSWKLKAVGGAIKVAAIITVGVAGFAFGSEDIVVYGFCAGLLYSAILRLISAFRKTAIVYIA